jgi:hypothetical protein
MAIDLTKPETELLQSVLEKELEEVRSEQHHTQAHEYKESLRERETLVRGLLARLRA